MAIDMTLVCEIKTSAASLFMYIFGIWSQVTTDRYARVSA